MGPVILVVELVHYGTCYISGRNGSLLTRRRK